MSEKQIFQTVLEKHDKSEATGITIPFDTEKIFGAKRVPVKVSINGAEYRSTVMKMDGRYMMAVPKVFREAAGVKAGETITVEMEKDSSQRTVEIPADFADALEKAGLKEPFEKISYTHRKEHVRAVEESKKEETRRRRIEKSVAMIGENKK